MKKVSSVICSLVTIISAIVLFSVSGSASFEYNDKSFKYMVYDDHAEVLSYAGSLSNVVIPSSIKVNGETCPVTVIGRKAFESNKKIKVLTIPESIHELCEDSFKDCTKLTKIYFNAKSCKDIWNSIYDGATVFYNIGKDSGGVDVIFGENVKRIPAYMFATKADYDYGEGNYAHIKTIMMSNSIIEIGSNAFENCYDLNSVTWSKSIEAFGRASFNNCYSLTNVCIPATTKQIDEIAFKNCKNLMRIEFNAVACKDINNWATSGNYYSGISLFTNAGSNSNGVDVVFGESVKSIPAYLFATAIAWNNGEGEYPKIKTVTIGKNVKKIGDGAFENCYDLKTVSWGNSIEEIGRASFYNCYSLTKVVIPQTTTLIDENAFKNCKGISKIEYNAKSCKDIMDWATSRNYYSGISIFLNAGANSKGIDVVFGSTVESIPVCLFATAGDYNYGEGDYPRIKSVSIGQNVKRIGAGAFYNCYDLKTVTIEARNISDLGNNAFNNCSKAKIYCHCGTTTDYTLYDSGVVYNTFEPFHNVSGFIASKRTTTSLILKWNVLSDVNAYYIYEYNNSTKTYKQLAKLGKNTTSYKLKNLMSGSKHTYAIRAAKTTLGKIYYSGYITLTTATKPETVQNLSVASTAKRTVKITFDKAKGANGYVVYYATSQNGKYKKLGTTTKTTYTNKKLTSGTTYYFKVRAFTKAGSEKAFAAYSPIKSVRVK